MWFSSWTLELPLKNKLTAIPVVQHFFFGAFEEFHFDLTKISFLWFLCFIELNASCAAGSVIPRLYIHARGCNPQVSKTIKCGLDPHK
jgi:hypothetical protein